MDELKDITPCSSSRGGVRGYPSSRRQPGEGGGRGGVRGGGGEGGGREGGRGGVEQSMMAMIVFFFCVNLDEEIFEGKIDGVPPSFLASSSSSFSSSSSPFSLLRL